jgi:hypothetical protein
MRVQILCNIVSEGYVLIVPCKYTITCTTSLSFLWAPEEPPQRILQRILIGYAPNRQLHVCLCGHSRPPVVSFYGLGSVQTTISYHGMPLVWELSRDKMQRRNTQFEKWDVIVQK